MKRFFRALQALIFVVPLMGATLQITVAPSPSPSPSGVTYDGCAMFPAYSYYNTNIASYAVDANSAAMIQSVTDADNQHSYTNDSFGGSGGAGLERLNVENGSATKYTVISTSSHTFPVTFPFSSSFFIEPGPGDTHSLVLDTSVCKLYELYNTTFSNSTLGAYSGDAIDLTKEVNPSAAMGGATAARTSLFVPAIKYTELHSGLPISHVISLIFKAYSDNTSSFGNCDRWPAISTGGLNYGGPSGDTHTMCMGDHVRLKSSFSSSACSSGDGLTVATALKQYGGYFDDSSGGTGFETRFVDNDADGSADVASSWTNAAVACLATIHITNFDVLATQTAGGP